MFEDSNRGKINVPFFKIQGQVDGTAFVTAVPERDYSLSCAKASRWSRLASSLRSCMIWT